MPFKRESSPVPLVSVRSKAALSSASEKLDSSSLQNRRDAKLVSRYLLSGVARAKGVAEVAAASWDGAALDAACCCVQRRRIGGRQRRAMCIFTKLHGAASQHGAIYIIYIINAL